MKDGAKKRGGKAAKSGAQSSQTGPAADAPSGPSVADVPAGPSAEPKGGKGEKGGKGWVTKAVAMTVGVGVLAAVLMVDPFSNDYNRAEAPGYDVWTLEIMSDVNKRLNSELETVLRASYQHGRQGPLPPRPPARPHIDPDRTHTHSLTPIHTTPCGHGLVAPTVQFSPGFEIPVLFASSPTAPVREEGQRTCALLLAI